MACNVKAGFVGFGEVNTPRELIERKCRDARAILLANGFELVETAPVADDPEGRDVARACKELAAEDFDVLILCVAGWIPSHAVMAVADPFRHKPMILWGLEGENHDGRLVTAAGQAGTTALRKPMQDMGYCFKYVVNRLDCPCPIDQIVAFASAARAAARLRGARIGQMGYRDMRLYGTMCDGVSLRSRIGPEIEFFEMLEIVRNIERLDPRDVAELADKVRRQWKFVKTPAEDTIEKSVRLFLALKSKITERNYEAVSLIDVDGVKKLLKFAPAGVFMLLHEELDVCTIPENDTLGNVTQLMMRYLTGQVGAYLEFYDFTARGMLMGVPDYVPGEIVDGPVTVMPTAFGEFGEGLLNVSKVKTGRVTLARLGYSGDRYMLHAAVGEAVAPRAWEEAGWAPPAPQLPSLEIILDGSAESFLEDVLGQHYILAYGDHRGALKELCRILGIEMVEEPRDRKARTAE